MTIKSRHLNSKTKVPGQSGILLSMKFKTKKPRTTRTGQRQSYRDAEALASLEAARTAYSQRPHARKPLTPMQKIASKRTLIALGVASIAVVIFGWIAHSVVRQETMNFDVETLLWLRRSINPEFEAFAIWLTNLGGVVFIPIITGIIALGLYLRGHPIWALKLAFGVGGAAVLNIVLKAVFSRARPDLWVQSVVEQSYSFPSGHSMVSAALAGSLVLIMWKTKWRLGVLIVGLLYTLVIGLTRMYLGVHYPTDILSGWALSVAWVVLVQVIFEKTFHRQT